LSIEFAVKSQIEFWSSAPYYDGTGFAASVLRAEFNLDGGVPWRYRLSIGGGETTRQPVNLFAATYLNQIDDNETRSSSIFSVDGNILYNYSKSGKTSSFQFPASKDGFIAIKPDGKTVVKLEQSGEVRARQLLERNQQTTYLPVCSRTQGGIDRSRTWGGVLEIYPLRPLSCFAVGVNWPATGPQQFDGPKAVDLFLGAMRLLPSFKMAASVSVDPSFASGSNRTHVLEEWADFQDQIERDESVVIYLVGHMSKERFGTRQPTCLQIPPQSSAPETCAAPFSGPNFLLLSKEHVDSSSYHLSDSDVRDMAKQLSDRGCSVLVVLDGCYSGGFEEVLRGVPGVAMLAASDGSSISKYKLHNGLPFMTSHFWEAIAIEKKYFLDDISSYISGSVLSEFENQPVGVGSAYVNGETTTYSPERPKVFASWNHSADVFGSPAIAVRTSWDCVCDVTSDGFVDDSDFLVFVIQYDVLVCDSVEMRMSCVCDYNDDGYVDDGDFIRFVDAYNTLICDVVH